MNELDWIIAGGAVYIIVALLIFFIPSFIASSRNHEYSVAIWLINILLGWTGLVWIGILIWAIVGDSSDVVALKKEELKQRVTKTESQSKSESVMGLSDELRKLKGLLDEEIITQDEFDKKKAKLLG
jgi:hypothetical protein